VSPLECVCDIGFYRNPNPIQNNLVDRCKKCPEGGLCASKNMSVPIAKPGYWFSSSDINSFYKCTPSESCAGGGPSNCSKGYDGFLCGVCSPQFYKSKTRCHACTSDTYWKFFLTIAVVGILIVVLFFLMLVASIKADHVASINIVFGFWQIISVFSSLDIHWPWVVDTTLSAASSSNFDVIFIYIHY
jgi:hypothetical protein